MPEITVAEYSNLSGFKDNIRLAEDTFIISSEGANALLDERTTKYIF